MAVPLGESGKDTRYVTTTLPIGQEVQIRTEVTRSLERNLVQRG